MRTIDLVCYSVLSWYKISLFFRITAYILLALHLNVLDHDINQEETKAELTTASTTGSKNTEECKINRYTQ